MSSLHWGGRLVRPRARPSKCRRQQCLVGSNPTLPATKRRLLTRAFFCLSEQDFSIGIRQHGLGGFGGFGPPDTVRSVHSAQPCSNWTLAFLLVVTLAVQEGAKRLKSLLRTTTSCVNSALFTRCGVCKICQTPDSELRFAAVLQPGPPPFASARGEQLAHYRPPVLTPILATRSICDLHFTQRVVWGRASRRAGSIFSPHLSQIP